MAGRLAAGELVDLREVTDFDWDRLGLFGLYTPSAEVERQLGVRMPAAADRQMNSESDQFLALVSE